MKYESITRLLAHHRGYYCTNHNCGLYICVNQADALGAAESRAIKLTVSSAKRRGYKKVRVKFTEHEELWRVINGNSGENLTWRANQDLKLLDSFSPARWFSVWIKIKPISYEIYRTAI